MRWCIKPRRHHRSRGNMPNRKLCTASTALACFAFIGAATATPAFKILNHQRLDMTARTETNGQKHLVFDAYGRRFEVDLQTNDNIARAVPADRSDIKPYLGTLSGQPRSWVRLTQTRDGWRGIVSDGQELYGIEPANELRETAVQPLPDGGSSSTPVIYRLADAIMPNGAAYCATDAIDSLTSLTTEQTTGLKAFTRLATELAQKDTTTLVPTRELVVDAVADHTFTDAIGSDPQGAIIARWDMIDGIWSNQVGIKILLSTVTVLNDANDPFSTTTVPGNLLAEVSGYRAGLSAHDSTGVTHLMTGRQFDNNVVGIAYLSSVCNGAQSVSLSKSTTSATLGALIAAHELGHNFNAVHDGVPGVCASTPQTYLMAPVINFSNQFSACSLQSIQARAGTAACLVQIPAGTVSGGGSSGTSGGGPPVPGNPTGGVDVGPSGGTGSSGSGSSSGGTSAGGDGGSASSGAGTTGGSGGGGRIDLVWLAFLGTLVGLKRARIPA